MYLTVLGSGGNSPIPMRTCQCRVCVEELFRRSYDDYGRLAREHGDLNVEFAYDGMAITV